MARRMSDTLWFAVEVREIQCGRKDSTNVRYTLEAYRTFVGHTSPIEPTATHDKPKHVGTGVDGLSPSHLSIRERA